MNTFAQKNIRVQKTARVHYRNAEGRPCARWMITHGYGMLSSYFSSKFYDIPSCHELLIPEGLHRFYLQGTEGRVGASWMTKEERETDIQDYIQYLNQLYTSYQDDTPLIAFGFSQGVATICRWAAQLDVLPAQLILWAGVIPPDVDPKAWEKIYTQVPITIFVGSDDPYRSKAHDKLYTHIQSVGKHVELIEYKGTHRIDSTILNDWCAQKSF